MYLFLKKYFIFVVIFSNCFFIGCSKDLPPEKRALEIVKDSFVLNEDKSVYRFIEEYLKQKGDNVKPGGWEVEKKSDYKYLVSYKYRLYSFKDGIGEKGFFFEVDLGTESVTDRTKEYLEKMKPLSRAYKSEKELFKEIVDSEDSIGALD